VTKTIVSKNVSVSSFRKVAHSGRLALFRDFLLDYMSSQFQAALAGCDDEMYAVGAAQRLRSLIGSTANVRAFVNLQSGNPFGFILPFEASRLLGLSLFPATIASFRFGLLIIKLSIIRFIKALVFVLVARDQPILKQKGQSICLIGIGPTALNIGRNDSSSHTLENWIRNNYVSESSTIFHSVSVSLRSDTVGRFFVPNFLPFVSMHVKLWIIAKAFFRFIACLVACFLGQWRKLFMLDDWVFSEMFRAADEGQIYDRYIFSFQGDQYRPNWSYIAEKKGALAVQLNYSANTVPSLDQKYQDRDGLDTATWNEIIPFSAEFIPFIISKLGKHHLAPKVLKMPDVHYSDNSEIEIPDFEKPTIALFDVAPLDERFHVGCLDFHDYLETVENSPGFFNRKFITDVTAVAKKHEVKVVIKPKRADPRVQQSYKYLLEKLQEDDEVSILPPDIAPSRLIAKCAAAIVMPFSTIGYFGEKETQIRFYDVVGKFDGQHEAAMGTKILSGYKELDEWLASLGGLKSLRESASASKADEKCAE
jgi:hypothetical protein